MAHTKVSINRNWYGKVPLDRNGKPIPRNLWPKRRNFSWEVRWYDSEGKRLSKSFKDRKEASEYVQTIQDKVDKGKADRPQKINLGEFIKEHCKVMVGQVAHSTLKDHMRALNLFSDHVDRDFSPRKVVTPVPVPEIISSVIPQPHRSTTPILIQRELSLTWSLFHFSRYLRRRFRREAS